MTLQDVIVRDMLRNRQSQNNDATIDEYNRKVETRMRKRFWKQAGEVIAAVLTLVMFVFLAWCFLVFTPNQTSAEAEACRVEMGN